MSRWTEAFTSHPFHADWANIARALEQGVLPEGVDLAAAQELARLRKLFAHLSASLENIDPELANPSLLGNLHGSVQGMLGEINSYFANGNIGHLRNANNNADGFASYFVQNVIPTVPSTKESAGKLVRAYQDSLEKHISAFASKLDGLAKSNEGLITGNVKRVELANEAVGKLEDRIVGMETQLPTQLSGYNTTFHASEAQRAERFEKWWELHQQKFDDQFTSSASKAGATIDVLFKYQEQAETVLGTVIDTAQAGAYAKYASEEKQSANLYRRLAILMMAGAALVLFLPEVANAIKQADYSLDWQKALVRLPFSLILFAPALYLAKESSRHRTNEVTNRRRQHILTTIGPYLALLDSKKAEEIKAEVAKNIFSDNLAAFEDKSADAGNLLAQLTNLAAALKRPG
jgi:hypothetical protein